LIGYTAKRQLLEVNSSGCMLMALIVALAPMQYPTCEI
jgi:hypothetical protein